MTIKTNFYILTEAEWRKRVPSHRILYPHILIFGGILIFFLALLDQMMVAAIVVGILFGIGLVFESMGELNRLSHASVLPGAVVVLAGWRKGTQDDFLQTLRTVDVHWLDAALFRLYHAFLIMGRWAGQYYVKKRELVGYRHEIDEKFFATYKQDGSYIQARWELGLFSKAEKWPTCYVLFPERAVIPLRAFETDDDLEQFESLLSSKGVPIVQRQ